MCGIAGIVNRDALRPIDFQLLSNMTSAIASRGPDSEGYWRGAGVGLGHRRLSIIDLQSGAQPLGNEDGSIQVVFNGEIYNYQSIRMRLLAEGHRFATNSDTEVLVHLYEERGLEFVNELRGMFAFAIWDQNRRRLVLGRDHIGQKPIYYCLDSERILFASQVKSILCDSTVDRTIDSEALESYFTYGFIPGCQSIFRSIRKLPPASLLVIEQGDPWFQSPKRYWRINAAADDSRSLSESIERIRDKFQETVALHKIADVPVGAFLSGGVDSSAIVAELTRQGGPRLRTFSIGFQEEEFSELPYARTIAKKFETEHIEQIVSIDAKNGITELTDAFDEPFADPSALPSLRVAAVASRHVKVVMSGDGGDEAFGGYARYRHDLWEQYLRSRIPTALRETLLAKLAAIWPASRTMPRFLRWKSLLQNLSTGGAAAYANTLSLFRESQRRRLLGGPGCRDQVHRGLFDAYTSGADTLSAMTMADINILLPDDFLTKVDRASGAHGLEVRPPLVDHTFLEIALSIPSHWKVRSGQGKWIFKKMLERSLPGSILHRRKMGFDIPLDQWLRVNLRDNLEDALRSGGPLDTLININEARLLAARQRRGEHGLGQRVWALLVLANWMEKYTRGPENFSLPGKRSLAIAS